MCPRHGRAAEQWPRRVGGGEHRSSAPWSVSVLPTEGRHGPQAERAAGPRADGAGDGVRREECVTFLAFGRVASSSRAWLGTAAAPAARTPGMGLRNRTPNHPPRACGWEEPAWCEESLRFGGAR